jgi:hypothetical protein
VAAELLKQPMPDWDRQSETHHRDESEQELLLAQAPDPRLFGRDTPMVWMT